MSERRTRRSATPETGGALLQALRSFRYEKTEVPAQVLESSGRQLNAEYQEKLVGKVLLHLGKRFFAARPCAGADHRHEFSPNTSATACAAWPAAGWRCRCWMPPPLALPSCGGDTNTASNVMFLLDVGEILEEWNPQEVGGGPSPEHVPAGGEGLAAAGGAGDPGPRLPDSAGGYGGGPHGQRDPL